MLIFNGKEIYYKTDSEYYTQGFYFLKATGTVLDISTAGLHYTNWDKKQKHLKLSIMLYKRNRKENALAFDFYCSVMDTETYNEVHSRVTNGAKRAYRDFIQGLPYSILCCVNSDSSLGDYTLDEFMSELYSDSNLSEYPNAVASYQQCQKMSTFVHRSYNEQEREVLREIQ